MSDADLHFYFDPVCPFAWMTSKWVRLVPAQRDYTVDWRFISLRLINARRRLRRALPARLRSRPHRRAAAAARRRPGPGRARAARRSARSTTRSAPASSTPRAGPTAADARVPRHAVVLAPVARRGRPARSSWPTRSTTPRCDAELQAETDEALSLTGKDVGTPILHFAARRTATAFFGPVISRLPDRRRRRRAVGPRRRRWPASPVSPSSSGACASGPSWPSSASAGRGRRRRRTGTAAAGG